MTDKIEMIGDGSLRKRKLYDPNLAEELNRKAELESKRKPKKEVKQPAQKDIEPPKNVKYFFLGGNFGKEVDEEVKAEYKGIEVIASPAYDENDKMLKGSNPFYVVAVKNSKLLRDAGIKVAAQADLENILR